MNIKATETHRLDGRPHIAFTDADTGKDIYPGGRYVAGAKWDGDPEAVIAEVWDYLQKQPAPVEPTAAVTAPIIKTDTELETKLAAMKAGKEANG